MADTATMKFHWEEVLAIHMRVVLPVGIGAVQVVLNSPRPEPPSTVPVHRSRRPPLRSTVSQPSCASGVKVPCSALAKAAATSPCSVRWLAWGQHVVGAGGPQGLHNGRQAAGRIDRDDGPLQGHAVEQAGESRDRMALGRTGLLVAEALDIVPALFRATCGGTAGGGPGSPAGSRGPQCGRRPFPRTEHPP